MKYDYKQTTTIGMIFWWWLKTHMEEGDIDSDIIIDTVNDLFNRHLTDFLKCAEEVLLYRQGTHAYEQAANKLCELIEKTKESNVC
jgi:hypothetical protein